MPDFSLSLLARRLFFAIAAFVVIGIGLHERQAEAHHGWSSYESEARTLVGPIKTANYANPHGSIEMTAEGRDYTVILAPVARMNSRGLSAGMLTIGKEVTVIGYVSRNDPAEVRAENITVDGKKVELR